MLEIIEESKRNNKGTYSISKVFLLSFQLCKTLIKVTILHWVVGKT